MCPQNEGGFAEISRLAPVAMATSMCVHGVCRRRSGDYGSSWPLVRDSCPSFKYYTDAYRKKRERETGVSTVRRRGEAGTKGSGADLRGARLLREVS